jgi:hypothetical protein
MTSNSAAESTFSEIFNGFVSLPTTIHNPSTYQYSLETIDKIELP